jgi:zinc protease
MRVRHKLISVAQASIAVVLAACSASGQTAAPPRRAAARPAASPVPHISDTTIDQMTYAPLRPVQVPTVDTSTLPNGMKLYLLEDHELPLVTGTALIRTGNLFDPKEKIGLAGITGSVLRSGGTKDKTGDQLDEALENIAASVESGIGETRGTMSFSALKENTDEVLRIFYHLMTAPEFREDKLDLAKTQERSSISRRNDDAHGIAQREFSDIIYGKGNPYGWREEYATIDAITRDDLIAFYRRYYFPANIMLAIRGDFSTPEMKARIEKLFAGWTYQQPPVPPFPKMQAKPAGGIFYAAKDDVTQTFFAIGELGGELRDKDLPALEVMADILGGGFQSRLVRKVRTELGYAYGISASWSASYDHPGLFEIAGSTKSMSTVETIKAIDAEVQRIRTEEVSDKELKVAKDTALNSFVFAFDTKAKTLGRLLTYEYYGYPKDFIYQYQKGLAAVTKADVLRVAKERVHPAQFTTVAVGRSQDARQLATLGAPVTSIDLTIPESKPPAAKTDPASLQKGRELLARAQQAAGGADKLAAIKDVTQVLEFQADAAAGSMKAKQVNMWLAPSYYRQESQFPFGAIVASFDGKAGWIFRGNSQGRKAFSPAELKQVQGEIFRLYVPLLLSDRHADRTVSYAGENVVSIADQADNSVRVYMDDKTGLPEKLTYQMAPAKGPPVPVDMVFSDMRDVMGVKLPFRIEMIQGGHKTGALVVGEYKINSGLKPEDLDKRP